MFQLRHPVERLRVLLDEPIATEEVAVYAGFEDTREGMTFPRADNNHGLTDGMTAALLCDGPPSAAYRRSVNRIVIYNGDSKTHIVSLIFTGHTPQNDPGADTPGPEYVMMRRAMPARSTLVYGAGGWELLLEDGLNLNAGDVMVFGAENVVATADTRFLYPGYSTAMAGVTPLAVVAPRNGVLEKFYVRHHAAVGNGANVQYFVRVNDVNTSLTVTLPTGIIGQAGETGASVNVLAGDRISVVAVKAAPLGNGAVQAVASFTARAV